MPRKAAAFAIVLALVACAPASAPSGTAAPSSAATASPTPGASPSATLVPSPAGEYGLGAFPALPSGTLPADVTGKMQATLDGALNHLDVPGIGAAVIAADRGTWAGAAGTADGDTPLDPAAQFGIGSVTKTVTAAQVLRLVESGAIDLDRPIGEYLGADVPTNGATVRQVIGMRSGIVELSGDPGEICADLAASFQIGDLTEHLSEGSLFEPGTRFLYTNANYLLAGLLIEKVTGTTVPLVLRSGVLAAPGLERLIYQDAERPTPPLAGPFVVRPELPSVPSPRELLQLGEGYLPVRCLASTAGTAGGMASDPMTLARWGYLLYGGSILGEEALAAMTTYESDYGLGAHDHESQFRTPAVGHEGTVPGYVAQLLAFTDEGVSVAVLVNTNAASEEALTAIAGELRAALAP